MRITACGKINWTLDILSQREDGYHLMDMLMQSVTLADEITLAEADAITLTTGGEPLLPANERHLALRAARALAEATGCQKGAAIHVEKRIPVGAGMGGGSADAAGVLIGLNRLWQTGLSPAALEAIGLTLGADVPFCLRGGLTRTTGIGEMMQPLPCARTYPLVVCQPCEGLSTKEIFQAYHGKGVSRRPDTENAAKALTLGASDALGKLLYNVMQPVSEARRPDIAQAIHALKEQGAIAALMTGSGSAVFGVFETVQAADAAYRPMRGRWPKTWRCETCMESVVIHDEA